MNPRYLRGAMAGTPGAGALALLACALLLTACGTGVPDRTITAAEASARVDRHIHDFAAAIPGAQLEVQSPMAVTACTAPVDGGPLGRVVAEAMYRVTGVPTAANPAAFDTAHRYLTDHGYRILEDLRPQGYLFAEAPDPDFTTIALSESGDGSRTLFIDAASPCVWPEGGAP